MGMESLPTPHNNFFHFALSQLPNARRLIETQLSASALAELDLNTLKLESGSFVDPDLREKFSDLLFSVDLASSAEQTNLTGSDQAMVYVLFEHKSKSEKRTAFQLLGYIVRIWEKRLREGLELCPLIPLLVYHGQTGWTAKRSLGELVPFPKGLAEYQVECRFKLLDLSVVDDAEISGDPILRTTLQLLKYTRSVDLGQRLRDILCLIVAALDVDALLEWIQAIEAYIVSVNKSIDSVEYKKALASVLPTEFEAGSLADRLLQEGEQLGLQKGEQLGLQKGEQLGLQKGEQRGLQKGEWVGRIHMLEDLLQEAPTPSTELIALDVDALAARLATLQKRFRERSTDRP
ncbi:MAG: Rpn family recombination-promoting nuclease/putative transposase [Planctomycetota bacterium]